MDEYVEGRMIEMYLENQEVKRFALEEGEKI